MTPRAWTAGNARRCADGSRESPPLTADMRCVVRFGVKVEGDVYTGSLGAHRVRDAPGNTAYAFV